MQANDQLKRYDGLTNQCRSVSAQIDLNSLVKILQPESPPKVPKKSYAAPVTGDNEEVILCYAFIHYTQLFSINFYVVRIFFFQFLIGIKLITKLFSNLFRWWQCHNSFDFLRNFQKLFFSYEMQTIQLTWISGNMDSQRWWCRTSPQYPFEMSLLSNETPHSKSVHLSMHWNVRPLKLNHKYVSCR